MSERLQAVVMELEELNADIRTAFGSLTVEQLNWKPSENEWSIAQCLEHIMVTNELYFPNIQKVFDGQHRNNIYSKVPFAADLIAYAMKNSLNPNQSRKMKTFKMFEPAKSSVAEGIVEDLADNHLKLIDLAVKAQQFDIKGIKIAEPLNSALNLRLGDAFEILSMHSRRHFNQAMRVKDNGGFPG